MVFPSQMLMRRLLVVLVAVGYLGAWGGDVTGLTDCPLHGGLIHGSEGVSEHGNAHPGHGDEGEEHDHGPCICVGDCVGAATARLLVVGSLVPMAAPETDSLRPVVRETLLQRIHTPFILPYSTAPPASVVRQLI